MRRIIIAATTVAFAVAAPAQALLECVSQDVLNGLVFNGRPEAKLVVSDSLPAVVDGFRAPGEFALIGSGVRGQGMATVVGYRTALPGEQALNRLQQFLSAEGWRPEIPQGGPPTFIAPQQTRRLAVTLCKNGDRRGLQVEDIGGVRYATITGFRSIPERACNAPMAQQFTNPMAMIGVVRASMPQFSLPASARMEAPGGGGSSGSTNEAADSMRIASPDTATSLAEHLAAQLAEQGWQVDARWNGSQSSGSTWKRTGGDGQVFHGVLEVLTVGQGLYDIGFTSTASPRG